VVAAVLKDDRQRILITRRLSTSHMGGLWEFPGGTVEEGESDIQALKREIREELGLNITVGERLWKERFEYDIKIIDIGFYRCRLQNTDQTLRLLHAQDYKWVKRSELPLYRFPPADEAFIRELIDSKPDWGYR